MANEESAARLSRLRILVAGVSWPLETFLANLFGGLLDAGVELTVASARKPSEEWFVRRNFHWLFTPGWNGAHFTRLWRLSWMTIVAILRSPRDLGRLVSYSTDPGTLGQRLANLNRLLPFAGRRWDAIYFPWNSAAISYMPLFGLGSPVVMSCRGSQINVAPHSPKRSQIREGLRETFRGAAAVHCVSEAIKREAIRYGLDPAKTWVIPPAVDAAFFRPPDSHPIGEHQFLVISVGSLTWVKGYEYALLAVRELIDGGLPVRLELIGDGPDRQRILYTIRDLELDNRVRLCGTLGPLEVRERLQQADVFVLSSVSEGIPNALLEAMACGVPVVTSDCGGVREVVSDGVEGFVVPVRDPDAMAQALLALWEDPGRRTEMGRQGRQRVETRFRLGMQVHQFLELYRTAASAASSDFHE